MNRSSRIKQLYHEIRGTLGPEISSKEALQLAAHLIDVVDERDTVPGAQITEQRATFDELRVDQAFADGGWKVLNCEKEIVRANFGGDEVWVRQRPRYEAIEWELAA
jgi:hypothetical protein